MSAVGQCGRGSTKNWPPFLTLDVLDLSKIEAGQLSLADYSLEVAQGFIPASDILGENQ